MTDHDRQNLSEEGSVDAVTMQSLSVMRMYHEGLIKLKDLWIDHADATRQARETLYSVSSVRKVALIESQAAEQLNHMERLDKILASLNSTLLKRNSSSSESSSPNSASDSDSTRNAGPESPAEPL